MNRYKFWKGDGESGMEPDPSGDWVRLSEMGEPVAEVLWHDPEFDISPPRPGKIIDASIAWMEAAPIGTKLYAAPLAPKQESPEPSVHPAVTSSDHRAPDASDTAGADAPPSA